MLKFVGIGAAATVVADALLGPLMRVSGAPAADDAWVGPDGTPRFEPVAYPIPHPGDGGVAATDAERFAQYTVRDEVLLPPGFRYDIICQWGDVFGPPGGRTIVVGHNHDYTGLAPIPGANDEFWLIVNHEYIAARPWLDGYEAVHGRRLPRLHLLADPNEARYPDGRLEIDGVLLESAEFDLFAPPEKRPPQFDRLARAATEICRAAMADLGVSVLHVRRLADGRFEVIKDSPHHFRISGPTGNTPEVAAKISASGPAAKLIGKPDGTFANCSGATTPWGTFLTCEENFQDQVQEFITPAGQPMPGVTRPFKGLFTNSFVRDLPFEFAGLGQLTGVDGRQHGWVCEVDPARRTLTKLTALGRFRHENVAIRCEKGKRLVAYMGDDRRGGHIWKYVSREVVTDPVSPDNSRLLASGTLYVARLEGDFKGRWIPLTPATPLQRPAPERCAVPHLWLPSRPDGGHVSVGTPGSKYTQMPVRRYVRMLEDFAGMPFDRMTLGSLVTADSDAEKLAVILTDAFAMANAVGGTPTARPEDIEVHPLDRSVYIAFTDNTGSEDGAPDIRVFPDSAGQNSRQYGAIYRIAEDGDDPAAVTFTWGKFVSSGEAHEGGGGFACADNLVFDPSANLWMVCDITTPLQNHPVGRTDQNKSKPGDKSFVGLFGNNAMFVIPTTGPNAGRPFCFATGPMECELTGPTFTPDGRTLLLSVQHPGECYGIRGAQGRPTEELRQMVVAARDGALFTQNRTVPLGSNFPSAKPGQAPRSCTICITRRP